MNFWPELSPAVQHAFQVFYGGLLGLVIVHQLAPHWRRYLVSDRWGGYAQSSTFVDPLHRPTLAPLVLIGWAGCAIALICNWYPVIAALANVLLCRYYFVAMRWRGVLRGFGAPGFMSYWFGMAVLLLAFTRRHAPTLQPLALLYLQTDIALIIFSAAFHKFRSGYRQGEGMDYGLVNPMWGYWPGFFRRLPTAHKIYRFLNWSAWVSQFASAALMLIPVTRWIGGLAETITYLFIATQIRLGWLAEQMMLIGLLFLTVGSPPGRWWDTHWPVPEAFALNGPALPGGLILLVGIFLWLQLVLTVLCHAGLFYNFYGRRNLPPLLQRALEAYANFFGIIIWRVFSVDHLNFYVNIYSASANTLSTAGMALLSGWKTPLNLRFWHVGEAITVTSLFTTLKYYPSNEAIFRERILRYSRTLPCPPDREIVFEYVSIKKTAGQYEDCPVCHYYVNPRTGDVRAQVIDPTYSPKSCHFTSPLHETAHPGTYAPKLT